MKLYEDESVAKRRLPGGAAFLYADSSRVFIL